MSSLFKRLLVGRPIATDQQDHQRLRKIIALATFSSDAISSVAYAVEEMASEENVARAMILRNRW